MSVRKTIPIRTSLTPDIFDEMKSKYPVLSVDGKEYKQNCSFLSFPSDFDFAKFSDDCIDCGMNVGNAFTVLIYMLANMANRDGYYIILNRSFIRVMASSLQFCGAEEMDKIISFLVHTKYIYQFDDKITSTYAVRTFETVQAARMSNRKRNKDDEPASDDKKEQPPVPAPAIVPQVYQESGVALISDDSMLF